MVTFFAAVWAGIAGGNGLETCAVRGLLAAVVMYAVIGVGGRVVLRLLVEEMVEHEVRRRRRSERDI